MGGVEQGLEGFEHGVILLVAEHSVRSSRIGPQSRPEAARRADRILRMSERTRTARILTLNLALTAYAYAPLLSAGFPGDD